MLKIAILGYGKEGRAVEAYFKAYLPEPDFTIFDNFSPEELATFDLSGFDMVFRTPSVPLYQIPGVTKNPDHTYNVPSNLTSITKYFFAHCPCPIIGVTGTKGKGTTCAMTAAILTEYFKEHAPARKVHFVGNVGTPAVEILDDIQPEDIVVYELSSFQLWDLDHSPAVAVILRIEPDHLDRHADFNDYLAAKSNLVRHQKPDDVCIYFEHNANSVKLANLSPAHKIPYPNQEYDDLVTHLTIPGAHNKENAAAAIEAVEAILKTAGVVPLEGGHQNVLRSKNFGGGSGDRTPAIIRALEDFKPLPHHIEFVRTYHGIDFYDDSFSASYPALDVALSAFADRSVVLIAGGKDRNLDLTEMKHRIFTAPNLKKAILIGETAPKLAAGEDPTKYEIATTLKEAVDLAALAGDMKCSSRGHKPGRAAMSVPKEEPSCQAPPSPVVLLSPGAASFDMFKNFYDRGDQFQQLVKELQ